MKDFFLQLDKDLFLFINGKHNDALDVLMFGVSNNILIWMPLFVLMGYLLIKSFKMASSVRLVLNETLLLFFGILLFSICFYLIPPFIESLIPRLRPSYNSEISHLVHLLTDGTNNKLGLFAPRVCFAFAITAFLFFSLKNKYLLLKAICLLWTILICYSKIYCGIHYPSNIILSGIFGICFGYLLFKYFFYIKESVLAI